MDLLKSLKLKVELFAGTEVREAACDLCTLATRIGVLVEANFNGIKLWARPNDNPLKLVEAYHAATESKFPHRIAQA